MVGHQGTNMNPEPDRGAAAQAEVAGSAGPVQIGPHESILVAVSHSPNSEYLLRWTKRSIAQRNVRWTALHVDTNALLRREDGEALQRNLELARRLGAEVVTIHSSDVARAVVRYARTTNISQIIIGKPGHRITGMFSLRQTLTDRIVQESGEIDVLVVQEKVPSHPPRSRFSGWIRGTTLPSVLISAGVMLAATLLGLAALPLIGYTSVGMIYLLVITGLVFFVGRAAAFIAPVTSALLWNYLFIPPQFTFNIRKVEDILMFAMFFVTAFTTGFLASRLKANESALAVREEKISLLYSFLQSLSEKQNIGAMADTSLAYIDRYFNARTILLLKGDDGTLNRQPVSLTASQVTDADYLAAAWCFEHREPAGAHTASPVGSSFHFVPLLGPDTIVGVLGLQLDEGHGLGQERGELLQTLLRNLSLSLERERLAQQHRKDLVSAESERLGKIMLNTISHELRTPLTTIKGAVTALLDADAARSDVHRELLTDTLAASDKLNRIVENLLSMSRLEAGALRLKRAWVDVDDLLGASLEVLKQELAGHPVTIEKEDALPAVHVDFVLLMQVIANVLQNSVRYTPQGTHIRLAVGARLSGLSIEICDAGPGVSAAELPHLFEKFYRGSRAPSGGCGLGLAICKGIVEAHGGTIAASSAPDHGLCIRIFLPHCLSGSSQETAS